MVEPASAIAILRGQLRKRLELLYPDYDVDALAERAIELMGLSTDCVTPERHRNYWDETFNILITYGDSIIDARPPLQCLHEFLNRHLQGLIRGVHVLPFFPYSSDDGFAVMDYMAVNPALGDWEDITALADDYALMSDLVINHASSRSRWFDNYKKRVDPGRDYFFEAQPEDDTSDVIRPRNNPLLTKFETSEGARHVWCTFSADQVDFDFSNPEVLLEFIRIIRVYLERGIKIFRMDAVAFLWKEVGTRCIHLPQTHEIIKLLRSLIEHHSPGALVITETNVPNRENLMYFGNANEAHIIYNFSLPPLLLYTLVSGDCRHLKTWMMSMPPAQAGTAYLNFIASHDGIGLRPLEGLVDNQEREAMLKLMKNFGGTISMRKAGEGQQKPYEINISLFDALQGTLANGRDLLQQQRYLCAHAIMMALEGIPALYIHSLLATENDHDRVEHTGRARSINRHIWELVALEEALRDETRHHREIFSQLLEMLEIRAGQAAFHPNATQFTLHLGTSMFAFWRQSIDRRQSIFCVFNITNRPQNLNLADLNLIGTDRWYDLLEKKEFHDLTAFTELHPYQAVWLTNVFASDA